MRGTYVTPAQECPDCGAGLIDCSTNMERRWKCCLCSYEVNPDLKE